jgi:ribosome biogenesis GTPase / thiamine phosphate phosphatase
VALLGSSGVGKSTLVNHWLGHSALRTQEVRTLDGRGRHTTPRRQLLLLPAGGLILDTPGMRELQLWEGEERLQNTFERIESLAAECRFRDCQHREEPGCAIQRAITDGTIDREQLLNYEKLQRELRRLAVKRDANGRRSQKQKWKALCRMAKERSVSKRDGY